MAAIAECRNKEIAAFFKQSEAYTTFYQILTAKLLKEDSSKAEKAALFALRNVTMPCRNNPRYSSRQQLITMINLHEAFVLRLISKVKVTTRADIFKAPLLDKRPMDPIIDGELFLGSFDAYDAEVAKEKITHIVKVTLNKREGVVPNLPILDIGVEDQPHAWKALSENFPKAFKFIDDAISSKGRVLVHCNVGISRSATVVMAYMMNRFGTSYEKTHAYVFKQRPWIRPNSGFIEGLKEYEKQLLPLKLAEEKKQEEPPSLPLTSAIEKATPHSSHRMSSIIRTASGGELFLGHERDYPWLDQVKISSIIRFLYHKEEGLKVTQKVHEFRYGFISHSFWGALTHAVSKQDDAEVALEPLFRMIDEQLAAGKKIFIHCSAATDGSSMSTSAVTAYLMNRFRVPYEKAFAHIRLQRPSALLHFDSVDGLEKYGKILEIRNHPPQSIALNYYRDLLFYHELGSAKAAAQNLERTAADPAKKHLVEKVYSHFMRSRQRRKFSVPNTLDDAVVSFHQKHQGDRAQDNASPEEQLAAIGNAHLEELLNGILKSIEDQDPMQEQQYYTELYRRYREFFREAESFRRSHDPKDLKEPIKRLYEYVRGPIDQ